MLTKNLAVNFHQVEKRYANFKLHPLNLELAKGQILGLVGPNGAGKSTCLALLMGFIKADAGEIEVLNKKVPDNSVTLKQEVAFMAETMRLYGKANLAWHINFIKPLFPTWDNHYAKHLAKQFELNIHQPIKSLSLGQRIKCTLLLCLARKPKLLVLDEPSTGLDPVARHELIEQLMTVMLDEENSVLFSSQFTQDVERLSDSIAFLDNGVLVNQQDKETYLERWKRVRITSERIPIDLHNITDLCSTGITHEFIHSNFSQNTAAQLQAQGFSIEHIGPLTLEEIFIHQVRQHRQQLETVI